MVLASSLQIVFQDLLSQAWQIVVAVVGILGGVTGLILFYDWIRPKVKNSHTIASYIDYETNKMVEEKEMEITWAYFPFFRSISLPRIPRDAEYEVNYKSRVKPKRKLEPEHYTVSEAGKFRKIKLVNKEFCTNEDVEFVYLTYKIVQNEEYRQKISEKREKGKTIILNDNLTEIRNYRVHLPQKVTMDKANKYFALAERFETDQSSTDEVIITALVLKPLPPSQSGEPGRIEVPL
jgi:hypothetical protein